MTDNPWHHYDPGSDTILLSTAPRDVETVVSYRDGDEHVALVKRADNDAVVGWQIEGCRRFFGGATPETAAEHITRATQYADDFEGCVSRALSCVRQGHVQLAQDELHDALEAASGVRVRLAEVARRWADEDGDGHE